MKPIDGEPRRTELFHACNFVEFYFEQVRDRIRDAQNKLAEVLYDALEVVSYIQEKKELYKGQLVRVANQQCFIQALRRELKSKCEGVNERAML